MKCNTNLIQRKEFIMPVSAKPSKKAIKKSKQQDSVKAKRPYVRKTKAEPMEAKKKTIKKIKDKSVKPKRKYVRKEKKTSLNEFEKKFANFLSPTGIAQKFVKELNNLSIVYRNTLKEKGHK